MHLKSEKIMLMWKIEVVLLKVSYTTHKNLVNLTNIYTIDGCALHIVPSQLCKVSIFIVVHMVQNTIYFLNVHLSQRIHFLFM